MNVLTQVREAVWSALENSADLMAFVASGRTFKLDAGSYLPTSITKDDCPALAVIPSECPSERFGESLEELRYRLRVVGYLYSEEAAKAEEFLRQHPERQRGRKGFVAPADEKDLRPCPRCGKKTVNRYLCHGCWDDRYRWDSGPDIFEAYEEANTIL